MLALGILAIALLGVVLAARETLDPKDTNFTAPPAPEEDVDWRDGAPGWSRPGRVR